MSSGVAPIFVESSGQNRIWVVKGANDRLSPADVDAAAAVLEGADFLVLQLEVPIETVYYALRFAREHGIRSILNPAPGQPLDLAQVAHADYVIPNETEAEALAGMPVHNLEDARACAQKLLDGGVRRVIVTLGANGALCAGPDGMTHVPAFAVQPVDTTGAGDAFIGSLACFLAEGHAGDGRHRPRQSLRRALHARPRHAKIVRHPRAFRRGVDLRTRSCLVPARGLSYACNASRSSSSIS